MAPAKSILTEIKQATNIAVGARTGITTRNQRAALANVGNIKPPAGVGRETRIKRKADTSPVKGKTTKRSALGNITNAIGKSLGVQLPEPKKAVVKKSQGTLKPPSARASAVKAAEKVIPKTVVALPPKTKIATRAKVEKKETTKVEAPVKTIVTRQSLDLEKSGDGSLYVSALEEITEEGSKKTEVEQTVADPGLKTVQQLDAPPQTVLPEGVEYDFDVENWFDAYQVSQYAAEIFEYLKSREKLFPISDYMESQVCLSRWMRSLLIDWMVEVQESFELNHETLYLAVKLVDLYLTKVTVGKETLQLLGIASLFIASKFDERIPPMVEDFIYICDHAYTKRELVRMEMNILKVIDFDLGIPLSYRFLRRYARCVKVSMPTLTLGRYILEYSLMDYSTISFSDSKMAAAALFLALQMKDIGGWTPALEYYTGYKLEDIREVVLVLNEGLHKKPKDALATVRNKYSHKIFHEVAKVPLKDALEI